MKSRRNPRFHEAFNRLPGYVKRQARRAYKLFKANPNHPGLNFKKIQGRSNIYSVRIGIDYRALAVVRDDTAVWFWIGPHSEYDKILKTLNL